MKNFSLKTKRNSHLSSANRSIYKTVVLVVVSLLLIFIFRGIFGSALSSVTMGVERISNYLNTSSASLPTYIRDRKELQNEINRLRQEVAAQSGSESTIARLSFENEELRSFVGDTKNERILAGVVARPPTVPYDLLVIDRGSDHGILEGAPVYHEKNHVIGVVSKVYSESALVTLFSSSGTETTVYLYGPNVFAYAYGEGGGVIRISVPQGITLTEGDPVVLPSIHSSDIGVIERIVSVPAEPEQSAFVTFPVSLQSVRTVSVERSVIDIQSYEDVVPNVSLINDRFNIAVPDIVRSEMNTTTPTSTAPRGATTTP
jgi:cell shape-determining protein MreC